MLLRRRVCCWLLLAWRGTCILFVGNDRVKDGSFSVGAAGFLGHTILQRYVLPFALDEIIRVVDQVLGFGDTLEFNV